MSMASALFILLPGHYLKTKPKIPVLSRSTHNDMLGIYRWVSVDPGTVWLVAIGISGWILLAYSCLIAWFCAFTVLFHCLISLPPLHVNAQANQSWDGSDQSADHDWDSKMM